MKQVNFVRIRRYLLIVFAAVLALALMLLIPLTQEAPIVADALAASNTVLPKEIQNIFKDYTLTSLAEDYDTLDELNEYRTILGDYAKTYSEYLTRAENIIYGKVRFNGMREFSTVEGAPNHIDQYGDLEQIQTGTLKWSWAGSVSQVIGIYGISNETFTVYVDASNGANLPSLVAAQSKGDGHNGYSWRTVVTLKQGINTFSFPYGSFSTGDKSGVLYIHNPYTPDNQNGNVNLYIEGGGFYPVYRIGDDEDVFIEQVKEFVAQRNANSQIPDIAELLPDYALLTITASSVYEAYVNNNISPAKNLEYWSNYFTKTFEFSGMSRYDEKHPVEPYIRLNIRRMAPMDAGAYTFYYHVGVYSGEEKWFADYTNDTLNDYTRFAHVGHEIGHMLDTKGRTVVETTNNVNAVNAYFRILGNSPNGNKWLPFTRVQSHIFSDYSRDDQGYDDGRIVYAGASNYDHNYMMWWYLESLFPGYWGKLNNYYRYDNSANSMNYNEQMVYYSSLVTGVDLSEYFERWGWYYGRYQSSSIKFTISGATKAFQNAMENARNTHQIEKAYDHFWYVDAAQFDFTLNHPNPTENEKAYSGVPKITSVKMDGSYRVLEIGGQTDPNLLGYEVYSKVGDGEYQVAGFTYNNKFTDKNTYDGEPTYMVRGLNRFFVLSENSNEVTGLTDEAPTGYVCKVGEKYYTDLKTAFNDAAKVSGTVYLLADCAASGLQVVTNNAVVTITVDESVIGNGDITITNSSNLHFFNMLAASSKLIIRGTEESKIILDGALTEHMFAAFYASAGTVQAEYVVVKDYVLSNTNLYGSVVNSDEATVDFQNCLFENCISYSPIGLIAGGTSTTTLKDCVFEGTVAKYPNKYIAAIGLNSSSGSMVLDNCTFNGNDVADIYVNGDITFNNSIPKAVVDFIDGYNTIKLSNCSNAAQDVSKITLKNKSYHAEYKNGAIEFVEVTYTLTFKSGAQEICEYKLSGTDEFTFGTEQITLTENQYIVKYVNSDNVEYHVGDTITVETNETFTVYISEYLTVTLKFDPDGDIAQRTVQLKQDGKLYLPRFDDNGKEIVKWLSDGIIYWAGDSYVAQGNDILVAIYVDMFSYTFVCRGEVAQYGYATYGEQINLDMLSVDTGNLLCWRVGAQSVEPNGKYTVICDVVFVGIYSDEGQTVYNLSDSVVTVTEADFQYDGQAKTPNVNVAILGEAVPESHYKVTYLNNVNAGKATITVEPNGYYSYGSQSVTFAISPVTYSQEDFDVENVVYTFVYNGNRTSQSPVVKWKDSTLALDKDYTVEYTGDRTNVGSVTLTIKFQGNFSGEKSLIYQIERANRDSFTVQIVGWTFGQTANTPSVWNYGNEMGKVTYTYALISSEAYEKTVPTAAGKYKVKAVMDATNNYNAAEATAEFTISKATLTTVPTNFTVDSRKKTLQDVADRLPTGWSWANAETALTVGVNQAEAVYKDTDNYTNARITVKITVTEFIDNVAQAQVTVLETCVYNGLAQQPAVKVELNGTTLNEGTDYTLDFSNNINAGTAQITVTGMGEYSGSKVVEFTIAKQDLSDSIELSVSNAEIVDEVYKVLYDGEAHMVFASISGFDNVTVTVDISSVTEVGEYTVKAKISADNYCGEKEFTVLVYTEPVEPTNGTNKVAVAVGVSTGIVGCGGAIGGLVYWFIRRRRR